METLSSAAFDYFCAEVPKELVDLYNGCYESLGWEYIEPDSILTAKESGQGDMVRLNYRRSHTARHRRELVALQQRCDAALRNVRRLEEMGSVTGIALSLGVGLLGVGLILWAAFSFSGMTTLSGALLCVLGFAGCAAAYPMFRTMRKRGKSKAAPYMEQAYGNVRALMEEARQLQK